MLDINTVPTKNEFPYSYLQLYLLSFECLFKGYLSLKGNHFSVLFHLSFPVICKLLTKPIIFTREIYSIYTQNLDLGILYLSCIYLNALLSDENPNIRIITVSVMMHSIHSLFQRFLLAM